MPIAALHVREEGLVGAGKTAGRVAEVV